MASKFSYFLWRLTAPTTLVLGVWLSTFFYFQLDRTEVARSAIPVLSQSPADAVLDEIARMAVGVQRPIASENLIPASERILAGALPAEFGLAAPVALQGYPQDYQQGTPSHSLGMASLVVENVLLDAYAQTHDPRFLDMATRRILAFATHEAAQRYDTSFLWNDHAVAGRIAVLVKLWRHVRGNADLPAESALEILSLVARSARLLAKPDRFTVRTNHGVAQNLALLQISAAFSGLPEADEWRKVAVARLNLQLPFYVSPEGVVLEHSAGYHIFGTELLVIGVRLMVLNGLVPPPALVADADNSRRVLALLMRPDGTLPVFGNTGFGSNHDMMVADSDGKVPIRHQSPPHAAPAGGNSLFPVAGYAVWWHAAEPRRLSQTVVIWAKHDGHGHKHADEGAVLFWSEGVDWITQTGYWPYGAAHMDEAYSWTASNAPHEPGEAFAAARKVQLLKTGATEGVSFLEVERQSANGTRFRRQVVQMDHQTWLVLDFAHGAVKGSETVWTIPPDMRLRPGPAAQGFVSSPAADGRQLTISYTSSAPTQLKVRRGSTQPFAGWVVVRGQPNVADALQVTTETGESASALLFKVGAGSAVVPPKIQFGPGASAEQWQLVIGEAADARYVRKNDTAITVNGQSNQPEVTVPLQPAPDVGAERAALQTAYATAVSAYPPWRELSYYRLRLTYVIGLLALLVEVCWLVTRRRAGSASQLRKYFHTGITACWLAVGVWVFGFYLP